MKESEYYVRHEAGSERVSLAEALAAPRLPVWGVLDRIRSAHNVGSMFRTADGAAAAGLLLCGYTPVPPHRHLHKTALRAVEVVPWQHFPTALEAVEWLHQQGVMTLAMEYTAHSRPLAEVALRSPVGLVMGNEVDGLQPDVVAACQAQVHLPMRGLKSSLNVSVAFGIGLYEVVQRLEAEALFSAPSRMA